MSRESRDLNIGTGWADNHRLIHAALVREGSSSAPRAFGRRSLPRTALAARGRIRQIRRSRFLMEWSPAVASSREAEATPIRFPATMRAHSTGRVGSGRR